MPGFTALVKSFDAATLVAFGGTYQNGSTLNLAEVMTEHHCQVVATFSMASDEVFVALQGSLDGANWYTMTSAGVAGGASAGTVTQHLVASGVAALYVRAAGYGSSNNPVVTTWHTSG